MKTELFCRVGAAAFGDRWQSAMARCLGVTPRTVARWVSDDVVPDDMVDRLRPVVRSRIEALELVRKALWSDREVARG